MRVLAATHLGRVPSCCPRLQLAVGVLQRCRGLPNPLHARGVSHAPTIAPCWPDRPPLRVESWRRLRPSTPQTAPRARAMLMAFEYGTYLLCSMLYDGVLPAVLAWLPYAAANIISGMALATLLDLQRHSRSSGGAGSN